MNLTPLQESNSWPEAFMALVEMSDFWLASIILLIFFSLIFVLSGMSVRSYASAGFLTAILATLFLMGGFVTVETWFIVLFVSLTGIVSLYASRTPEA